MGKRWVNSRGKGGPFRHPIGREISRPALRRISIPAEHVGAPHRANRPERQSLRHTVLLGHLPRSARLRTAVERRGGQARAVDGHVPRREDIRGGRQLCARTLRHREARGCAGDREQGVGDGSRLLTRRQNTRGRISRQNGGGVGCGIGSCGAPVWREILLAEHARFLGGRADSCRRTCCHRGVSVFGERNVSFGSRRCRTHAARQRSRILVTHRFPRGASRCRCCAARQVPGGRAQLHADRRGGFAAAGYGRGAWAVPHP
mmetsp:Transcript_9745/g.24548  ORF Transcript_9745/g.24548 Transcript_9745/m.24548 type:complete len:261 (-) Transcript_9745:2112-2894(-)